MIEYVDKGKRSPLKKGRFKLHWITALCTNWIYDKLQLDAEIPSKLFVSIINCYMLCLGFDRLGRTRGRLEGRRGRQRTLAIGRIGRGRRSGGGLAGRYFEGGVGREGGMACEGGSVVKSGGER